MDVVRGRRLRGTPPSLGGHPADVTRLVTPLGGGSRAALRKHRRLPHTGRAVHGVLSDPMDSRDDSRSVRQLRLVVEAHDFDEAVAFFRDAWD